MTVPRSRTSDRAFTMTELIVTIVVLGLLAALAVPALRAVQDRTHDEVAVVELQALHREAAALAALDSGQITATELEQAAADIGSAADEVAPNDRPTLNDDAATASPAYGHVSWDVVDGQVELAMLSRADNCAMLAGDATSSAADIIDTDGADCVADVLGDDIAPEDLDGSGTDDEAAGLALTATGLDAAIDVSWPHADGATSYTVDCWTDGRDPYPTRDSAAGTATVTVPDGTADGDTVTTTLTGMQNFVKHTCQATGHLTETSTVDFEDGAIPSEWTQTGGSASVVTDSTADNGTEVLQAAPIIDDETWTLQASYELTGSATLAFDLSVSTESGWDEVHLIVDGTTTQTWSGLVGWSTHTVDLDAGSHTVAWQYTKDSCCAGGADTFWLDNVIIDLPTGEVESTTDTATPTTHVDTIADPPPGGPGESIHEPDPAADPQTLTGNGLAALTSFPSTHSSPPHQLYATLSGSGTVVTVVDDGSGSSPAHLLLPPGTFTQPEGIAAGPAPDATTTAYTVLYVADAGAGTIHQLDPDSKTLRQVAAVSSPHALTGFTCHDAAGAATAGTCLYVTTDSGIVEVDVADGTTRTVTTAVTGGVGIAYVDGPGADHLLVSTAAGLHRVGFDGADLGEVTGTAPAGGVGWSPTADYTADPDSGEIDVVGDTTTSTLAGSGGFDTPTAVHHHGNTDTLYVADAACVHALTVSSGDRRALWCPQDGGPLHTAGQHSIDFGIGQSPAEEFSADPSMSTSLTHVEGGLENFYAIDTDGTLWVRGDNDNGQLGVGTTTDVSSWTSTSISDAVAVTADYRHALVVTAGGDVYAAGQAENTYGYHGWLGGAGSSGNVTSWTLVPELDTPFIVDIATGQTDTLAVADDGTLYAGGEGRDYIYSESSNDRWATFDVVTIAPAGVTDVAMGRDEFALVVAGGELYGAGRADDGQLGISPNHATYYVKPYTPLGVSSVKSVDAGQSHSAAVTDGGVLYTAGYGYFGQLGRSGGSDWAAVTDLSGVSDVAAGGNFTVARTGGGQVYGTGQNGDGRLGVGDTVDHSTFAPAVGIGAVVDIAASASLSMTRGG